jgi:hypothetical protein
MIYRWGMGQSPFFTSLQVLNTNQSEIKMQDHFTLIIRIKDGKKIYKEKCRDYEHAMRCLRQDLPALCLEYKQEENWFQWTIAEHKIVAQGDKV